VTNEGIAKSGNPGRGLRGSLDTPLEDVEPGEGFLVGGWVIHRRALITQVVVTLNDEVIGLANVDVPREDIRAMYPGVPGADRRGWNLFVSPTLLPADVLEIKAYALVQQAAGDARRLGPWVQFAERTVEVRQSGNHFGLMDDPGPVTPGPLRISGTAWAPTGLTRVELSMDGVTWARARQSLPGATYASADVADALLGGFAGYVHVPDAPGVPTVRAVAVGRDGRRHELVRRRLAIEEPGGDAGSPSRPAFPSAGLERQLALLADTDQPGRVLVATHSLDLGGAQLYLSLLLDRLAGKGIDLCVVTRRGGPLLAGLEAAGIPVLVLGGGLSSRDQLEGRIQAIAAFAAANGARACLGNTLLAFPAVAAAQRLGLPTTWAIHESFDLGVFWRENLGWPLPAEVDDVAVRTLHDATEVVFEAEATSRLYADLVPADHHSIVRYGVESDVIDAYRAEHTAAQARSELGLGQDTMVLCCVGTVEERKAQLSLVRAFERIPPAARAGVELVVVGMNDSPYADALRLFVEASGIDGSVHLVDVTPEVYRAYLASDVLVAASDIESLPRTMLEAMLMGRPVASTAVFGVPELVEEGRNGFLCDPLDLESLTRMLERVISTPREQLEAMGAAARDSVRTAHDPSIYVEHFWTRLSGWLAASAD
jgi:D-inositol-3-phosphate glycosyltransferase